MLTQNDKPKSLIEEEKKNMEKLYSHLIKDKNNMDDLWKSYADKMIIQSETVIED